MRLLILSYFDKIIGPKIFLKVPDNYNSNYLQYIPNLIDYYDEGYFIHEFVILKTANLIFQISSPLARGYMEIAMISIVLLNEEINPNFFQESLKYFVFEIKRINDIYQGFYIEKEEIKGTRKAYIKMKDLMNLIYNSLPKKILFRRFNIIPFQISYQICKIGKSRRNLKNIRELKKK